jgi:general stress protein 26
VTQPADTPSTELDASYSSPDASPTDWERAQRVLADAQIYWLTTVRADGRPHVTPVIALWAAGALHFCTGPDEQKAKNLAANSQVILTTGNNGWAGLDVVVEGRAERITAEGRLRALAAAWESKYGAEWHFEVADGAFVHGPGQADVFAVAPVKAYAYDRDEPGGATRYRF